MGQFTYERDDRVLSAEERVIGHGQLRYRVVRDWTKADPAVAPVVNAHAMAMGNDGLYYLVTDHPDHAFHVFRPDGTFIRSFGTGLKGGHGVAMLPDGDRELVVHVDCGWEFDAAGKATKKTGSVNLLTKDGDVVRTLPDTIDLGLEAKGTFYGPCDVAITPGGDILVIDGYSSDRVLHFTKKGKLVRHWGGHKPDDASDIRNGHGISIDPTDPDNPVVWISSREQNQLKRFTLEGKHIDTIDLPGAYAGQAVFHDDKVYTGVCWSKDPKSGSKKSASGFVLVLDRKTGRVLSAPGGTPPPPDASHTDHGHPHLHGQKHPVFRHVHDLMVDAQGNIFVMEWNAGRRYPYKLELVE
ncbi:hypothetical protein Hhel01_01465 [Haloferula helveola]